MSHKAIATALIDQAKAEDNDHKDNGAEKQQLDSLVLLPLVPLGSLFPLLLCLQLCSIVKTLACGSSCILPAFKVC